MLIEAVNIHKSYEAVHVLKGVSLSIRKGELVSIVGSSGAGKSTLLHILGTLDKPDSGEIRMMGVNTTLLKGNTLAAFRNKYMGFIFQFHNLLPEFTALENICIPAYIGKNSKKEAEKKAQKLMELLKLTHRKNHKPNELSGGEQQRVAVARALINSPSIVFADEPSGNLDSENAANLHQLFVDLKQELNQTFVIVTHNLSLASLGDHIFEMKDGLICQKSS